MKKLYNCLVVFIILVLSLYSCQTDEIDVYDSGNFLQFTVAEVDTVEISFLMLGSPATYDYPLIVRHIGMPSATEAKPFTLSVVDTCTNIKSGMYSLPEFIFQPWSQLDTFYVKLISYPELTNSKAVLCLQLQDNEYFSTGDRDYKRLYLKIHNNVLKPSWWDSNTQRYLLGTYTDAKFRALIQALNERLGSADLSNTTWNNKLVWAIEFKAWLEDHPDVREDNGQQMTVPVVM